jgi:hypothetical protein
MMSAESSFHCRSCQTAVKSTLNAEIAIHFPGLEGLDKPLVWVFPKLLVCLNCGLTEFEIPEAELRQLVEGGSAAKKPTAREILETRMPPRFFRN